MSKWKFYLFFFINLVEYLFIFILLQKICLLKNTELSKLPDEELLLLHKESGKKNLVRELFNRYLPLIYGVCLNYLKDAENADEAVMQIFNDLLYRLDNYDVTAFRPWIYDFTKNYCLLQQGKENDSVTADTNELAEEFEKIANLYASADEKQTALLANCLKELPQEQRISVNYFFKDKLSYAEIVERADYKLKHVKKYIQKGKQNLLSCIEKADE